MSDPCIFTERGRCRLAGSGNRCNGTTDTETCPFWRLHQALAYLTTLIEQWKTEMVRWR